MPARWKDFKSCKYTLQVAPEDCTGCALCVAVCPAKSKSEVKHKAINMAPQAAAARAGSRKLGLLPEDPGDRPPPAHQSLVKDIQLLQPLFEFSGACAGCGETPYIKLMTQLFGDRAIIGNATGCSSIYGGNLPTTPYTVNSEGLGPAWSNSLFEDNAEFGLGMRLAIDKQKRICSANWWRAWHGDRRRSCAGVAGRRPIHRSGHFRAARACEAAEAKA